jgi:sarcosine oxidase subunit beta
VGAGGHGLATAYYLARRHGITDVAVLERGYLAGGNVGRNTTVVRSNYLWDESAAIYEFSLTLWEGLEDELGSDLQFRQMGVLNLAHSVSDVREGIRRVNANRLNGVDAEWLDPVGVKAFCPLIDTSDRLRFPVLGGTLQRRGGTARHDAMAWAFARAADAMGVDLIQGCEVTAIEVERGRAVGVRTSRGPIAARLVLLAAAGHTSVLASSVGLRLPLQSHPLQALVSDLHDPLFEGVVLSNAIHVYVSQARKGELVMGAGIDAYLSYAQRGSIPIIERQLAAAIELFPAFARAHVIRTWAGIVDVCPDASPIIGPTPVDGLYLNCGWGTGGFKATPGAGFVLADTLATGRVHPLALPYGLDRFTTGALVDEHGAAAVAH